jgi:hypothetical protein
MHRRVSECPRTFDERADHVGFIQIPERTVQNVLRAPADIVRELPLAFIARGSMMLIRFCGQLGNGRPADHEG